MHSCSRTGHSTCEGARNERTWPLFIQAGPCGFRHLLLGNMPASHEARQDGPKRHAWTGLRRQSSIHKPRPNSCPRTPPRWAKSTVFLRSDFACLTPLATAPRRNTQSRARRPACSGTIRTPRTRHQARNPHSAGTHATTASSAASTSASDAATTTGNSSANRTTEEGNGGASQHSSPAGVNRTKDSH